MASASSWVSGGSSRQTLSGLVDVVGDEVPALQQLQHLALDDLCVLQASERPPRSRLHLRRELSPRHQLSRLCFQSRSDLAACANWQLQCVLSIHVDPATTCPITKTRRCGNGLTYSTVQQLNDFGPSLGCQVGASRNRPVPGIVTPLLSHPTTRRARARSCL